MYALTAPRPPPHTHPVWVELAVRRRDHAEPRRSNSRPRGRSSAATSAVTRSARTSRSEGFTSWPSTRAATSATSRPDGAIRGGGSACPSIPTLPWGSARGWRRACCRGPTSGRSSWFVGPGLRRDLGLPVPSRTL